MSRRSGPVRRRLTRAVSVAGAGLAALLVAMLPVVVVSGPAAAAQDGDWWQATWRVGELHGLADGAGVTVAVIDSGVDGAIRDLAGAVRPGIDLTGLGGDGLVDHDLAEGHGTGMASLIAGTGAGGTLGAAPGATILAIAVNYGPSSAVDQYSEGIRFAVDNGAQVINMSVGSPGFIREPCPERVAAAVRYAVSQDVVVVAGSGNDVGGPEQYPAACPGVLTIGAVDEDLDPWENSHLGDYVDLAAPGVRISSTGPAEMARFGSGTSGATALVSGVVALIRSSHPDETAHQVVNRLVSTAQDLAEPGHDPATGHGLVRPVEALTAPTPPETPNPVYDGLDLTDTADPGPGPPARTPPAPPSISPPPMLADNTTGDGLPTPYILIPVIAAALTIAATVTLLAARARRRPHP